MINVHVTGVPKEGVIQAEDASPKVIKIPSIRISKVVQGAQKTTSF